MRRIITLLFTTLFLCNSAFSQEDKSASKLLAMQLVESNKVAIGINNIDTKDLLISDSYLDAGSGTRYVYLQQQFKNIPVYQQLLTLSFKNGKLLSKFGRLNPSIEKLVKSNSYLPNMSAIEAINLAIKDRGLSLLQAVSIRNTKDDGRKIEFAKNLLSDEPMTASLIWVPIEETINKEIIQTQMKLAWQVYFVPKVNSDYWSINVDANDGKILGVDNYTDYDQWGHKSPVNLPLFATFESDTKESSLMFIDKPQQQQNKSINRLSPSIVNSATYRVVPFPAESPWAPGGSFANRTDPWLAAPGNATSLKWHTGLAGADYNYTRGNNVWAYEDRTGPANTGTVAKSASSTTSPDPLNFVFVNDTTVDPTQRTPIPNQQFNTTSVFYWSNIIHDIMYQYGFNEAAGNFQDDNQGRGGTGNDHVNAEAQDGAGLNNANFSTPVDGGSGRMQMFLWNFNGSVPNKDGDIDNSIVVHEYGHGISNRLTGGPSNSGCLGNAEHMGEGWSDYYALMFTQNWATANLNTGFNSPRGIGLYGLNNGNLFPASAPQTGIRHFRYSTNFAVNSQVYLATLPSIVHDRGEIWCSALWEMTWEIINQVGFIDPNIYNASGTGGNVVAFRLVTEGLKLQQCSPGFISGRNAIIQADINLYGGIHVCAIRKAFARRGMGTNASEGSTSSVTDQIVDFSDGSSSFTFTQSGTAGVPEGQNIIYTHNVAATCNALTGYTLRDTLPLNVTFVSATNGGTYNAGNRIVSWPVNIAEGASATYLLTVNINPGSYFTPNIIIDEPVASTTISPSWTAASTSANVWTAHNVRSNSAPNSFFSPDVAVNSDQTLATTNSFALGAIPPRLSFWHNYATESTFDGCVVEISTNGGTTWADIGEANMTQNPYNSTISTAFGSVIGGRRAWSGNASGFVQTIINMTAYANQPNVKLRWRMASDNSVGATGWNVDDINLLLKPVVILKSTLYNNLNAVVIIKDTVTDILPGASCTTNPIVTNNADAGAGSLRQAVLDACPGSTITFNMASVVSPIVLTSGEIILNKNLNILGPGAGLLTVSGNNNSRIFYGTASSILSVKKLTFTAGNGAGVGFTGRGGAVANAGATLTLDSVIMTANTANIGGALNTFTNGTSNVLNTTISNNTAASSGGAVQNFSGSFLNITRSTITGNTSNSATGGGAVQANGTTTFTNSTFSSNTAGSGGDGGAIAYNGSAMTVTNCTFANNSAGDNGGAIYFTSSNLPTFLNTIIANNTATTNGQDIFGNVVSQGYNLVGKADGSTGFTSPTDLTGTIASPLNTLLGPLASNGGVTQTMALLNNSPAIDKGRAAVPTDQNGTVRPIDFPAITNAVGGDGSDIGAYEVLSVAAIPVATATPALQTICSAATIVTIVLTSTEPATTYAWTRDNVATATGIAAAGTGDISGSLTNTTAGPITVTFTIIPTASGTPGAAIQAIVIVNPTATVNAVSSQAVCNAAPTTAVTFTSPTTGGTITYNWTNSNINIGLAASGIGNISSFTATNTSNAPITATITVTPSYTNAGVTCVGTSTAFTITVNPTATVNAVSNQVVCNAAPTAAVTFTSPTTGGTITYNWTNSNINIGLAASGIGNIPSFTATNTSNAPIMATVTVTPSYTNAGATCLGTAATYTIIVNPTATVTSVVNQVVCQNTATNAVNFSTPTTGGTVTYNWTNNTTSIGLAASGSGNIPSFNATNAGATPVIATITVTPTYVNGGATCVGAASTFTITVNPLPTLTCPGNLTITSTLGACTAAVTYMATITGSPTPTTTYTLSGATVASGSGTGSGSLFNVGVTTVTITAVNTCTTRTCSFTVTVNDVQPPLITSNPVNTAVCSGTTATFSVTATNAVSYQWQRFISGTWTNVSGATSATLVLNNATIDNNTYTYRVIAIGLCSSVTSSPATLTVNPLPSVSIISSQTLLVPGSAFNLTAISVPVGGSYVWYRDGVIIPGITGNIVAGGRIDDRATYKVVYTALNGCVNTSADFVVGSLATNNMYVYPNPNNGRFQIRFDNQINEAATVYIWNSLGQIVYTSKMNTGAIPYSRIDVNLSNMAAGMYLVKLVNAAGREIGVARVIMQ